MKLISPGYILALTTAVAAVGCKVEKAAPMPPTVAPAAAASDPASQPAEKEKEKDPFGMLTLDEVEARLKDAREGKGAIAIFDNNSEERFKKSHVPTARWVKFDAVTAADLPADKATPLVFYCANEH